MNKLKSVFLKYKYAWPLMLVASLSFNLFLNMTNDGVNYVVPQGETAFIDTNALYKTKMLNDEKDIVFVPNIINAIQYAKNKDFILVEHEKGSKQYLLTELWYNQLVEYYRLGSLLSFTERTLREDFAGYAKLLMSQGIQPMQILQILGAYIVYAEKEFSIELLYPIYQELIFSFEKPIITEYFESLTKAQAHKVAFSTYLIFEAIQNLGYKFQFTKLYYAVVGYSFGISADYLVKFNKQQLIALAFQVHGGFIQPWTIFSREMALPRDYSFKAVMNQAQLMLDTYKEYRVGYYLGLSKYINAINKFENLLPRYHYLTEYIEAIPYEYKNIIADGIVLELQLAQSQDYIRVAPFAIKYPEMEEVIAFEKPIYEEALMAEERDILIKEGQVKEDSINIVEEDMVIEQNAFKMESFQKVAR